VARTLGDGGWCWFGDPRALYFADRHRKTYVGWVDRSGDLTVASFDHRTRHVERAVLKRGLSVDDHNSPGLLMRANGHLSVYYTGVDRQRMHYRRASDPEDITNFGPEHDLPTNTAGRRGYTYPNPIYLSEEKRVYLFWRGAQWWPAFSRHSDGNPWRPARTIMRIPGQRPYLKFASDGKNVIDIAYTEGNAGSFVNSIYYLRYRAGAFRKTDGTRVARVGELPISPQDGERVYDARQTGVRAWVWDIALRPDGRRLRPLPGPREQLLVRAGGVRGRRVGPSPDRRRRRSYRRQLRAGYLARPREPRRCVSLPQGRWALHRRALAHRGPRGDLDAPQGQHRRGRRLPAADHAARSGNGHRCAVDAGRLPRLHRLPHEHPRALRDLI